MNNIRFETIVEAVSGLFIDACCDINHDIENALKKGLELEDSQSGKIILKQILENIDIARKERIPICQDTGAAIVFIELGQDVHIDGGYLYDAVNEGVRQGYTKGYHRNSMVKSPIERINTNDNTPAIIHTEIIPGDRLRIIAAPKGFGSENMSALKMLKPFDGREGIKNFVMETVLSAGANPCPPIILGIGLGGTFEMCALLAKKALLRDIEVPNSDPIIASLERELLEEINKTGIGPQGLGGRVTCLGVNILSYPTHIAGFPAAVNIQCHASRHKEVVL